MSTKARVVYHDSFEGSGLTEEQHLLNSNLITPAKLDVMLTLLLGRNDKRYPLTFLAETTKGGSRPVDTGLFLYDVMGKTTKADTVAYSKYLATDKVGLGGALFVIPFRTNWFKDQHNITSPTGQTVRITNVLTKDGNHYNAVCQLVTGDPNDYVNPVSLQAGALWAMGTGANVAASRSRGNESNFVAPGRMKQQTSFLRKSFRLGGNVSNKKITEIQFMVDGANKPVSIWGEVERLQHISDWKTSIEEACWWSTFNMTPEGVILTVDPETQLPIPYMAGVDEQIPNRDTFSELTEKKLMNTIRHSLYGADDQDMVELDLYTGLGGAEDVDRALKSSAAGFTQIMGDKFVRGSGSSLEFGGYFARYKHRDGHTVNLKRLSLLDRGHRADSSPKHPITGLPRTSHDMYFIDTTNYGGVPNVMMTYETGRAFIQGILKGMAPTPYDFAGNKEMIQLSTERDESSIHFMASKSVVIRRPTHCFKLECNIS